jgi:mono/diheme cytochrome c family protein
VMPGDARGRTGGDKFFFGRRVRAEWITAFAVGVALIAMPYLFKLDGKPHTGWEQFLGRFHVLAVHLPIALILLVPVLELAGMRRPALRETAGIVLALALASACGAFALGYLLAYGSGESGATVTRHLWGAVALVIGLMLCILARPIGSSGEVSREYPALLVLVVLTLIWTAHQGGSLVYGAGYLTEYMPAPIKRIATFGVVSAAPKPDSFYAKHIDPIFDSNCVSCHGGSKTEAGLRLDSYANLMKGGKDGPVIAAGAPEKSVLLARVTLPAGDKHFMPAEGRPPLRPEEIAWIRAWIGDGASPTAASVAGVAFPERPVELPVQPVGDYSALMPEIRALRQGQGARLAQVSSKPSDGLILSTIDAASSFGDAQLAQFQKFAPYIVEAELGRTAVTDASFDTLAQFTHLRALHLEGTAVTGAGLAKLAPLTQLTYLNMSGTKVTASALAPLASMKNLRHVYVFNTPAQPSPQPDTAQSIARSAQ